MRVTIVLEAIPTKSKGEQGNTPAPPGAARALIPKKMTKKIGKIAQLRVPLTRIKKMIRKIMEVRKMKMTEKIAKVLAKNLIDL